MTTTTNKKSVLTRRECSDSDSNKIHKFVLPKRARGESNSNEIHNFVVPKQEPGDSDNNNKQQKTQDDAE